MTEVAVAEIQLPAWFDAKAILVRYLEGQRTEDIASTLGTNREKLVYWLVKHAEEDWRGAQFLRAIRRKEEAEDAIDAAKDMLELNKADRKLKSAQWDLERVCRRIYGDTQPQQTDSKVLVSINLRREPADIGQVVEASE